MTDTGKKDPLPAISVVIRTKNEGMALGATLEAIRRQEGAFPSEILLVDSGSVDGTLNIARRHDCRIITIPPEDFTYGYALNLGISHAAGEIICLLSAHCTPRHNRWLSELVQPVADGSAHAAFGRQVPVRGVNPFEEVSLHKLFPEELRKGNRVPFSNANCAFLKTLWDQVPFDETVPGWEDYLWYLLLRERFRFRYCPGAAVSHSHPFSFKKIMQRTYNDGRAFRIIKNRYGIDIYNHLYPGTGAKLRMLMHDVINHLTVFRQKGYRRYIPLIPFIRAYSYFTYWRGYRSVERASNSPARRIQA